MTQENNVLTWGAGAVSPVLCGHTYQDDLAMLTQHLGAQQPRPSVPLANDTTPPTISSHQPVTGSTISSSFQPCITASDPAGIRFAMAQLWIHNGFDPPKRIYQQFLTTAPFVFPSVSYATNPSITATLRMIVVDLFDNLSERRTTLSTSATAQKPPPCQ
jgi:hypothetical protein